MRTDCAICGAILTSKNGRRLRNANFDSGLCLDALCNRCHDDAAFYKGAGDSYIACAISVEESPGRLQFFGDAVRIQVIDDCFQAALRYYTMFHFFVQKKEKTRNATHNLP